MPPPEFLTAPLLPARHAFFTRRGGVSVGPYSSLNCALGGQDSRESVLLNRALATQALAGDPSQLVGLNQVHGATVVKVDSAWLLGQEPRADGAVTKCRGVTIGIVTADCAPVLFADPVAGVVGGAHAGWRGAVAGVLEATMDAMESLGARRDRITIAIGPCIGQSSYEVGAELRDTVLARDPTDEHLFAVGCRPKHWQFDLVGYCVRRLRTAGGKQIVSVGIDTMTDADRFFSHRRRMLAGGGVIGHQISMIVQ